MPRHVAFLRGVSPTNARMPDVQRCFEAAGFTAVSTILASGNVAFDAPAADPSQIERRAEQALLAGLGRPFPVIVRTSSHLQRLLEGDPYAAHGIPPDAKCVVTFLRAPAEPRVPLPLARDLASVFVRIGGEVYSAYLPTARGPVFMVLIERAFGSDVTTRTWQTVQRCAAG